MAEVPISWLSDWDEALTASRTQRRPLLIDVWKDPCVGCAKLATETYVEPAVQAAINERFVPLRLDLFRDRSVVRPLNVLWTPTLLFADRRGIVHYRSINFLPPADYLDLLDIGEANVRLRWAEYDRTMQLLADVSARHPDGPMAPEAIYWRGIAAYLKTRDNPTMYAIWQEIRDHHPDSIWALRIP